MIKVVSCIKGGAKRGNFSNLNLIRSLNWIDSSNPSADELNDISKKFLIFTRDLKDCLDHRELPRVQIRERYTMVIVRAVRETSDSIITTPVGILIGKNFVLTIHKDEIHSLKNLFTNLLTTSGKAAIKFGGVGELVYMLILEIIRDYNRIGDALEEKLIKLEDNIHKSSDEGDLRRIFSFKRSFLFLRRALKSNRDVIGEIQKNIKLVGSKEQENFNSLYIELNQLISVQEVYGERLASSMDIHMNNVSNRLNEVMKSFTVIASLVLLPMLITGIYGMNFLYLPLSKHPYGFYMSLIMMVIAIVLMLAFFKHKKWV